MHLIAVLIIAAIIFSGVLGTALLFRQAAAIAAHRESVPAAFAGEVSLDEHRRAAAYTLARTRLAIVQTIFDTVLALLWLTLLLGPVYDLVARLAAPGISRSVAIVAVAVISEQLLHLPFSIFATFSIEARFGFNRQTAAAFAVDRIKGAVLSALFGLPLLYGLFLLLAAMPRLWWLIAWAAFMAAALAMSVIVPAVIAPLFNKFTPLPDGPLRARLEALLAKCGFEPKGLYAMDASKRSTHGNAYFTGFGKAKRIVLFDTLLRDHTPDEILSILAHELGHYKLGHIGQRIALSAALAFLGFAALGFAFAKGELAGAFGLAADPGVVLIVAAIAAQPVLHLLSPLTSWLSRRAEYQADSYAKMMAGAAPIISALTKLARHNLSTLTPDAVYAFFYYSHPPLPVRIAKLKAA
jgi:STE24 endopeptidase